MTDNSPTPEELFTATDARRAVALIAHAATCDRGSMKLLLAEVAEAGQAAQLAAALAACCLDFSPDLRTDEGLAFLRTVTADLAVTEESASDDIDD